MIITENAKAYIEEVMKEIGESNLRLTIDGGGCCGINYKVTLEEMQQDDTIEMINGIQVSMDKRIGDAASNILLDFEGTEDDGGLFLHNQNGPY